MRPAKVARQQKDKGWPPENPAGVRHSPSERDDARLPFLDGIRACAVVAVLLYHAGVAGVGGGLLGVDVFFVLSGFLITSLLCQEHLKRGTIGLRHFWGARARRLLPALFILLLGVAVYAWVLRHSVDVGAIRVDALSTLLYVANWHFIISHQGYFSTAMAPSPLLHMWSLAVEEQYYLIWPVVVVLLLRRRGPRWVGGAAAVGAAISALVTASMYLAHVSTDRLYYGTDTRAQALLVGSALGAIACRRQWRVVPDRWIRTTGSRWAGVALGALGAGFLLWAWHAVNGQGAFLYEGGFLLVALATGAVLTAVTSWRHSVLARILSWKWLTYVGRLSYGLYLYHWPLFLVIDHGHSGLSGTLLLGARLAATFSAAVVSFHLVEQPIRQGRLAVGRRGLTLAVSVAGATAAVIVAATVSVAATVPPVSTTASTGLSVTERRALMAAHAFSTKPVRFLLLGDSVAVTASVGLAVHSIGHDGVKVIDGGVLGCDLDISPSLISGQVYRGSPGYNDFNCGSWRSGWPKAVARYQPEIVGLLIGRFELADHFYDGAWRHLGQQQWDTHLRGELDQAVRIFTAHGARVALFTFPYIDPLVEQPNGSSYPENTPRRVNLWNQLLREVAAAHPNEITLINLNRILDPAGHFTTTVDGVPVRWPNDGVHVSLAGGEWLQPRVLPEIAALGLRVRARR